jgi:hypothetical protein
MNISYRFNEHHRINVNDVFQYVKTSPGDSIGDATMQGKTGMEDYTVSGYPARLISNSGAVAWEMTLLQKRLVNEVIFKVHSIKSQIYGRSWIQMDQMKGVPYQDHNTEHHPGFSEALRFKILPPLLVKASYERVVRLPDQAELFGDGATVLPAVFKDSGLVPEKAHHLNLGFNFTKEDWGAMPRFEAELNGFYYDARDKIKLVPGFGGAIYDNVQHTRTLGVEGEVKADVRKWLYLTANASFNDERLIEDYPLGNAKEGDRVPNQPWLKANAAAELTWFDMFAKGNKGSVFWEGGYTYEFYRS